MSRILVIGGYGGFGGRLCRRLAAAGHDLIVAGRSAGKAARFCAGLGRARPLLLDRTGDVGAVLAHARPDLVIDAAGPFQGSGLAVPCACIDLGIPYLDLADSGDFVAAVRTLDGRARTAGVAVVAGASSAPALSGAVARHLAEGLDRVDRVDIALSVANRATGGDSIIAAGLSYVGKPVRLWRGRRWTRAYGWQEMRREDFLLPDGSGLRRRLVAIGDMPDQILLPELLPGRPAVTFRAGTELGLHVRFLWLASWPVRWRWLASLASLGRWPLRLYRLTAGIGGDRSAMSLTLTGAAGERAVERRWTLVADRSEGLEVPTLAAAILAGDILAGRLPAGAHNAAALLSLDRFEPGLAPLAIRHEISERALPPPLYARVMGPAFDRLPPAVRALHQVRGDAGAAGEGTVSRGGGRFARALAAAMRMPPAGTWPLHVAFAEQAGVERWTRDFGGHAFASELRAAGALVTERFGALRFAFALEAVPDGLEMKLRRWSWLGIRLPLFLAPRIAAREWQEQGRFHFDVRVAMPLAGEVVRYRGELAPLVDPPPAAPADSGSVRPAQPAGIRVDAC